MGVHHFPVPSGELASLIAETSVDPCRWADVFAAFERLFPGTVSVLYSGAGLSRTPAGPPGSGEARPVFFDGATGGLDRQDLAVRRMWDVETGATVRYAELWPPDAAAPTGFDEDLLQPTCERPSGGGLMLHRTKDRLWMLLIRAPRAVGETYDAAILALLARFRPQILSSFRISYGLGSLAPPSPAEIEAVWDALPYGVALVTPELSVLAANVTAEEILSTRRLFAPLRGHHLRAASAEARGAIEAAVDLIASRRSARESVALADKGGRPAATIQFAPLHGDESTAFLRSERRSLHPLVIATIRSVGERNYRRPTVSRHHPIG